MTIAQQLHNSATHAEGIDPACPVCNPAIIAEHVGYQHHFENGVCILRDCKAQEPAGATTSQEVIDLTPDSVKTPAGAAKLNKSMDALLAAQAETANAAGRFIKKFNGLQLRADLLHIAEDWDELADQVKTQEAAQETFVRAVAGR
jgi:hypothetical protein